MRPMLPALMVFLAACAWADPNELTDGVLVAHHVEALPYSGEAPPGGWCAAYGAHAVSGLEQVVARLSGGPDVWYVLAAWEYEAKTWGGTEFGFGAFDPAPFVFYESGACFPAAGLEIRTPGWPGPNEGTAVATTGDPWQGNWTPVYWFGGYTYGQGYGATIIPIDIDPPTGFCGFLNCMIPPRPFVVSPEKRGGMGVHMPGIVPAFSESWACCLCNPCGACAMLTQHECAHAPGIWMGPGYTCEPVNPCPPCYPGACCIGGLCVVILAENCRLLGGTFQGIMTACEPNPCPAVCCHGLPSGHECMILPEPDCLAMQGFWHPEWTACEPNPCEIYTPAESSSWGRIKGMYR